MLLLECANGLAGDGSLSKTVGDGGKGPEDVRGGEEVPYGSPCLRDRRGDRDHPATQSVTWRFGFTVKDHLSPFGTKRGCAEGRRGGGISGS